MKKLTPIQAIRKYCIDTCMCGSYKEVRLCNSSDICPLFPFRMGMRPETYEKRGGKKSLDN